VFIAGESSGWEEVMLSGVRLTATLSGAQPVEQQMCPLHSVVLLVGACSLPKIFLPFQNITFTSSCRQTLTSWAPAGLKWAVLISGIRVGALLKVKAAFSAAGRQQGSDSRCRDAATNSPWLWRQLGLCKLCPRPSLCPCLQTLVCTCPRAALSDDA